MEAVCKQGAQTELHCPVCNSGALYKNGRIKNGKQRFLCLICGRQFTPDAIRREVRNKPLCPNCGGHTHLNVRGGNMLTFRCANYPQCRTYIKIAQKVEN